MGCNSFNFHALHRAEDAHALHEVYTLQIPYKRELLNYLSKGPATKVKNFEVQSLP